MYAIVETDRSKNLNDENNYIKVTKLYMKNYSAALKHAYKRNLASKEKYFYVYDDMTKEFFRPEAV